MAYNVPSKYQPIWDTLKLKHQVEIIAPQAVHRRVIKAVINRKDSDAAYKFLCSESHKKAKLRYKVEGNKITFSLVFFPYFNSAGAY